MSSTERLTWGQYFTSIAIAVSSRATCLRAKVGVVIVKDNRILATGYNGSGAGDAQCDEVGCIMEYSSKDQREHCVRTTHAEINALGYAARYGVALEGATLYSYKSNGPAAVCRECRKASQAAGIIEFISEGPTIVAVLDKVNTL